MTTKVLKTSNSEEIDTTSNVLKSMSVINNNITSKKIIHIISNFGDIIIRPVVRDAFTGFYLNKLEADKILSDVINLILINQTDLINILLIDNAIRQFSCTYDDIFYVVEQLYQHISAYAKNISDTIQQDLKEKKFCIENFLQNRVDFIIRTSKLAHVLSSLWDVISLKGGNICKIIADYVFYEQILNRSYEFDTLKKYMFAILFETMDKTNHVHIINVFKIINTYNGFSYSLKDKNKRNDIFNIKLDEESKQIIINKKTTEEFVEQISNNILKLYTSEYDNQMNIEIKDSKEDPVSHNEIRSQYDKLINNITDSIHMCQRISDPIVFMMLYYQYLQKRLLSQSQNDTNLDTVTEIETILAKQLRSKDAPEIYMSIILTINDIRAIDLINTEFHNIPIRFESDKYSKEFQETYDRNKTEFIVLRKNVWNYLKDSSKNNSVNAIDRFNEPMMIKNYLDMFNDFYEKYFKMSINKNGLNGYDCRRLKYNYSNSVVELSLEFGDQLYKLKTTLVQACILTYIIDARSISVSDLSTKLNMKLQNMTNEINTLLISKLVLRNTTENASIDDINIKLSINPAFKSEFKNIDLTSYLKQAEDKLKEILIRKEQNELKKENLNMEIRSHVLKTLLCDPSLNHKIKIYLLQKY